MILVLLIMVFVLMMIVVEGVDYENASGELVFETGEGRQCHQVKILEDVFCELPEVFYSNLTLSAGIEVFTVDPDSTTVLINDSMDCS